MQRHHCSMIDVLMTKRYKEQLTCAIIYLGIFDNLIISLPINIECVYCWEMRGKLGMSLHYWFNEYEDEQLVVIDWFVFI